MTKRALFCLLVVSSWLLALLVILIPKNEYVWMREEFGPGTVLPEDGNSEAFVGLLFIYLMALSIFNFLLSWFLFKKKELIVGIALTLIPVLLCFAYFWISA